MDDDIFFKFWNSLNEKSSSTLRFFDRQDYYTVHFEDAEYLARNYFRSLEVIKYFKGKNNSPYININKNISEELFRYLLIENTHKVEMYRGKEAKWELIFTVSPGNIDKYQDTLFANADISISNSLLAVNVKKINEITTVYLGLVNLDKGTLELGQFDDVCNEFDTMSNLNSILYQLNCRECLIPAKDSRIELMSIVKNTIIQSGLVVSEYNKSYFNGSKSANLLTKLLSCQYKTGVCDNLFDKDGKEAIGCLNAVVSYLELASDESYYDFFEIKQIILNKYMHIGEKCNRDLNILPLPAKDLSRYDSLYGLLNDCRTTLGERLLMQWLRQPLMDVSLINKRLDLVESFINNNTIRSSLYGNHLRRIPDILRLARRMQRKKVTLQDLYKLYMGLSQIKEIHKLFVNYEGDFPDVIESEFTKLFETLLSNCTNFTNMIESTLDFEAIKNQEYKVKPDIDESLMELEAKMTILKAKMEKEFIQVCSLLNMEPRKQVKFEFSNILGYHMRMNRKEDKLLQKNKTLLVKDTHKDGVKFQSIKMEQINEEYKALFRDYEEFQKNIIDEVVKISVEYVNPVQKLSALIAKLDVFVSLANVAISAPDIYVRPKFVASSVSDKQINLTQCRHPLVEMQNTVSFIPNDAKFSDNRTFHIITGPNMGGKSTYIRSIGMTVIMAQIGSFVPCQHAELSVFDRVMTRIGAGDCQLKGVSTFMAEMLDISWILKDSTEKSLIIIDELGRGTSTFDGYGLAWAISEYLIVEKKACSLFATHFHELTQLANLYDNAVNLHVTADTIDDNLTFMYQIHEGPATKSYGVELARMVGLPEKVTEMANKKLKEYEKTENFNDNKQELFETTAAIKKFCNVNLELVDNIDNVLGQLIDDLKI